VSARRLVVNADDFGYSSGINRGIVECHARGVVTSTSLMVTGHAVPEALELSREHPGLSIGLHWDVFGEDERDFDLDDTAAVRDELERQLDEFHRLLGKAPTHVDSHRHAHREPHLMPLFEEWVEPLGVPLRGDGRVRFIGGFYAQWEWEVTTLEYVSVPFFERLLREEVGEGWNEISCHPGYVTPGLKGVYLGEREEEIRTLTDSRLRSTIDELGIELLGYDAFRAEVVT
jgi:chitin disaccharide deacetylase